MRESCLRNTSIRSVLKISACGINANDIDGWRDWGVEVHLQSPLPAQTAELPSKTFFWRSSCKDDIVLGSIFRPSLGALFPWSGLFNLVNWCALIASKTIPWNISFRARKSSQTHLLQRMLLERSNRAAVCERKQLWEILAPWQNLGTVLA